MSFDPWNTFLKIQDSIRITTPKMESAWECVGSFLHIPRSANVPLGLHSRTTSFHAFALVTSPRLGLQQPWYLGHVKCGWKQKTLELLWQMQQGGVWLDSITFVGVLNAWASMVALEESRCVHK